MDEQRYDDTMRMNAQILDVDREGYPLYQSDVVADIDRKLEKAKNDRLMLELQWVLNANFYSGHQYCDIHPGTMRIMDIPPPRKNMERAVFNKIAPLMQTRLANLEMVDYAMTVQPRTNELDDAAKAEVATGLLRYAQQLGDFNNVKNTLIMWAELTGTAFVLSWWDTQRGDELTRETASEVVVDRDSSVSEPFMAVYPPHERVIYEGDLNYGLLTPYEVYPADLYKQEVKDQRYIILDQVLTVEEVYDVYGVEVTGEEIDTYMLTPVSGSQERGHWATTFSFSRRQVEDAAHVKTYFEAKSRRHPDGRMIIVIGEELFFYGKLPYEGIPLAAMKSQVVPGQFFGKSVIQELIPLQRTLNGYMNRIHSHAATLTSNTLLLPDDSGIDREALQTMAYFDGRVMPYRQGANKPSYLEPQPLPAQVYEHKDKLVNDMEYAAGVSQLMVTGATPAGVTSGTAIDNLKQIDSTRMSLTAENIRSSVIQLAKQWLDIYKRYSTGYRAVRAIGENNIGSILTWSASDLNSCDIEYNVENELVYSRDSQKEAFLQAVQLGFFTDSNGQVPEHIKRRGIELLNAGRYHTNDSEPELQRQNAQRENAYLAAGTIPVIRDYIDDHQIHIQEHREYMLQRAFLQLEQHMPSLAEAFKEHVQQHIDTLAQKAQQMMAQNMAQSAPERG